jgi:hypothetical protein
VSLEAIPAELRERPQWVLWRYEVRDGKSTKAPWQARHPDRRASSTDTRTWSPFEEAIASVEQADGLGYVFSSDDPYFGVDLDGALSEADQGAVMLCLDTYAEHSVSGTGYHVIGRGKLPEGSRNRRGPIEVYDRGRFFVMTGAHVRGAPETIEERQDELETVLAQFLPAREPAAHPTAEPQPVDLADEELLERARAAKNGADFERLWTGDTSGHPSHSEADLALCSRLAFWTGRDPERIDRMFRASGLYREKWERNDYRTSTIEEAIAGCREVFAPRAHREHVVSHEYASPDHSWRPLDLIEVGARPPEPPAIAGILYRARRHVFSGEAEALKTWLLLAATVEEVRAGRGVVWVDSDGMGAGDVLERLRCLGLEDEAIHRSFAYVRPEEPLDPTLIAYVQTLLAERNSRLLVFDSFNPTLGLHGLDPSSTIEVERFWRHFADPFTAAGVAVAVPDHVVKAREQRGKYAYGSERKHSGADVHLGMTLIEPAGRGRTGRAKLTVHKDRPGFFERPSPGLFVLTSDPTDGRCRWEIEPDSSVGEEGEFRPTHLMERVSRYLEISDKPRSRRAIEENVKGKAEYVRRAIDALIGEGYAVEFVGPHGARLVQLETPFRQHEG